MQLHLQVKHTQCEATSERAAEVQGRGSSKSVYVVPHFPGCKKTCCVNVSGRRKRKGDGECFVCNPVEGEGIIDCSWQRQRPLVSPSVSLPPSGQSSPCLPGQLVNYIVHDAYV